MSVAEQLECSVVSGRQSDSLFETLRCFAPQAEFIETTAQIEVRFAQTGVDADRLAKGLYGQGVFAPGGLNDAQIVQRRGVWRRQGQGVLVNRLRLIETFKVKQGVRQIILCRRKIGIQANGLAKAVQRRVQLPETFLRIRKQDPVEGRFCVSRLLRQGPFDDVRRLTGRHPRKKV